MNKEYSSHGNNPDEDKLNKEEQMGDTPGIDSAGKANLASHTDENYKVLNSDGSLPDLPDEKAEGDGALDGTVGLGT